MELLLVAIASLPMMSHPRPTLLVVATQRSLALFDLLEILQLPMLPTQIKTMVALMELIDLVGLLQGQGIMHPTDHIFSTLNSQLRDSVAAI